MLRVTLLVTAVKPFTVDSVSNASPPRFPCPLDSHQNVTRETGGLPPVTVQRSVRFSPGVG